MATKKVKEQKKGTSKKSASSAKKIAVASREKDQILPREAVPTPEENREPGALPQERVESPELVQLKEHTQTLKDISRDAGEFFRANNTNLNNLGKLTDMKTSLSGVESSLSAHLPKLTNMTDALGNVNASLGTHGNKLDEMKNSLGSVNTALGSHANKLNETKTSLDSVNASLGTHGNKLDEVKNSLISVNTSLATQGTKLDGVKAALNTHGNKLDDVKELLGAEGPLTRSLGAEGPLTKALGKEGDLYKVLDGMKADQRLVQGIVRLTTGKPLTGCVVRAYLKSDDLKVPLGQDITDIEGRYSIQYASLSKAVRVDLTVVAFDDAGRPISLPAGKENAGLREELDVTVTATVEPGDKWIEGRILLEDGRKAVKLKLRLYRRIFGGTAELLNENSTDEHGNYALSYHSDRRAASLEIRAVRDPGGQNEKEVPLCKPLNDLTDHAVVNLIAPSSLQPCETEYSRLSKDLTTHIGEMANLKDAKENGTQQDITLLNRATGWDARLIALAAITERLVDDVRLPSEVLYGLLRAGLPSDKLLLAQVDPDVMEMAIKKARDAGVVGIDDAGIADLKRKFTDFANSTRLAMPMPGSRSTYGQMLEASTPDRLAREKFAPVYLKHRGNGAQLWEEACKAGLTGEQIGQLQLQGKMAFLAGNSMKMTNGLLEKGLTDPVELVGLGFHRPEGWKDEVFVQAQIPKERWDNPTADDLKKLEAVIPTTYVGKKVMARLDAYAEDMARKVRQSYPTQVLGCLIETDPRFKISSVDDDNAITVKLLKDAMAQGFRLGETPVSMFLQSRPGLGEGLSETALRTATENLKMVQRVYQITPSNEAMPVLRSLGMNSAFDVMGFSEDRFHLLFKVKYQEIWQKPAPAGMSELIVRKAKQVSSVMYNLFVIARRLDSEPPIMGISGTPKQQADAKSALKSALKAYPTLESLFGSMDYCECEHCRSVLSPAAYLVDLLQFVDTEQKVDTPYDVLIKRRPDLPHIALTCENTNTTLPYIDIVNEILEYYVAKDQLAKEAARDTGDAATADLLAEPQNVIPDAYDKLRAAPYPLNLPFDLWLETVRKFCDYFETPLHRVLDVIRPDEDLYAPIQNPTNVGNATVSIANTDAAKLTQGMVCTYLTASANVPSGKWKRIHAVGNPDSGGPGQTTVTFEGTWASAPSTGDRLVYRPLDSRAAIFLESLGLSPAEVEIFADTNPLQNLHKLYGFEKEEYVTENLKSAKTLSRRLGVTYKEITDIVQTEFVNPELGELSILYKLGVSVRDAMLYQRNKEYYNEHGNFYNKNKGKSRRELSSNDQKRYDELDKDILGWGANGWGILGEIEAFEERLEALASAFEPPLNVKELQTKILQIDFDRVLVLADPNAGCNFDQTTLQYADGSPAKPIDFLRINLFVRLWRRLGWSIEETDRALTTFVPQSSPFDDKAGNLAKQPLKTALIYLAHLKELDEKLKIGKQSRLKLLTLWSDIATTGKKPLYAQLFLNRGVLKSSPVFDDPYGKYLTKYLTKSINLKLHAVTLQGALGLTADEIKCILADAGKSFDNAQLSLANVSLLYRHGLLAKALKLSVRELIALKHISGLDPFKALHEGPLESMDQDYPFTQTLEFVKVAEEVKDSGLKIDDLEFLLRHRFDETGKYRPNRDGALALLKSLSEGVRAIRAEHSLPDAPAALSEELLRQKLGLALPPDVVDRFLGMVNGTAEFTVSRQGVKQNGVLPAALAGEAGIQSISYDQAAEKQSLIYRGVLFDTDKIALQQKINPRLTRSQRDVLDKLLTDVQAQAVATVTDNFTVTVDDVAQGRELPADFAGQGSILGVSYDATTKAQSLTYHGVLTDLEKSALMQRLGGRLTIGQASVFQRILEGVQSKIRTSVTSQYTAEMASVSVGGELPPDVIAAETRIREAPYSPIRQEHKLTVRGVLFAPAKSEMKTRFDAVLSATQKQIFADLLDELENLAREFFEKQLKKQKLRLDGEAGFLEESDFTGNDQVSSLFAPLTEKTELQQRHYRIAMAFMPFLQRRLIRQFIIQTMTAHTGADPVLVESLVGDDRLLAAPKALLDAFAATAARGLDATFANASGVPQPAVLLADADTSVKDSTGKPLKPAGADSVRVDAYLEVPVTGAYRFYIELDKQNAEAELRFPHRPEPVFVKGVAGSDGAILGDQPDEYLELKAGVLYRFSLELKKLNGGDARLLVQGESVPKGPLSQLPLYPAAAMENADRASMLLSKALQLVQGLGLSQREIQYLLTHSDDFDGLSLSELPTKTTADSPAERAAVVQHFARFRRLAAYARLKRDLASGTDDLIGIFEASPTMTSVERQNVPIYQRIAENAFSAYPKLRVHYDALNSVQHLTYDGSLSDAESAQIKALLPSSALLDELVDELRTTPPDKLKYITKLTRRGDSVVKICTAALFPVTDIKSEKPLWRLWEALQVVERFGVSPASLLGWADIIRSDTTKDRRFELAREVKEAIKARFEPETWQRVAQPIFDKLRQRQRDALVSFILQQMSGKPETASIDTQEKLYEHFLIDPGMEPVVQTSRIRLAISSVQLFIQRCLLNLEPSVHPSMINSEQWEWMKRYRVWEANRKIFLFPENWLEPEFRDDKTHLFTELEGALLQGDVSSDLVEDAFLNYLKKLDELARLDICAMHLEDNSDPTLHVFGRTYSEPHKYFYRRYANQMWTPWEPVSAQIEGDHLAPVVWRGRLYLFWVTFLEKAHPTSEPQIIDPSEKITLPPPTKDVEAQLHWSEYTGGQWTTRESGDFSAPSPVRAYELAKFDPKSVFIHVSKEYDPAGKSDLGVFIHLSGDFNKAFYLAGRNSAPEAAVYAIKPANLFNSANTASANRYCGSGSLKVIYGERIATEPGRTPPKANPIVLKPSLASIGSYTILPCNTGVSEYAFQEPRLVLHAFGYSAEAGAWRVENHPRFLADVTGDGKADIVGFYNDGVYVALSKGDGTLQEPKLVVKNFGAVVGGWDVQKHPRFLADLTGDGRADIVGFGTAGVWVALNNGDGSFQEPRLVLHAFGYDSEAGAWRVQNHPRFLADVTGDGKADIVGFGDAGVYVALSKGDGTFQEPKLVVKNFGAIVEGWDVQKHPRFLADLTGDGRADIVGFYNDGVYVALSKGDGTFQDPKLVVKNFGAVVGGWDVQKHPRFLADLTGDGRADIVGFGPDGVWVALNNGDGSFQEPRLVLPYFGYDAEAGAWRVENHPRFLADLTGDGRADIVGFGTAGVWVALNNGDGSFQEPTLVVKHFGVEVEGWDVKKHPRFLADLTGFGGADIIGFGDTEVWVALNNGAIESRLNEIASLKKPVFYQDNRHTFFIEPNVVEQTIEVWDEWVPGGGEGSGLDWEDPGISGETKKDTGPSVTPGGPIEHAGDQWGVSIDRGSLIDRPLKNDWLVNPGTLMKFDGGLIGPTGLPGIEIESMRDLADRGSVVNINPASGLAGGTKVVLRDEKSFASSGLKASGGGFNIVGGAGFTSALQENLTDMKRSDFGAGEQDIRRMKYGEGRII